MYNIIMVRKYKTTGDLLGGLGDLGKQFKKLADAATEAAAKTEIDKITDRLAKSSDIFNKLEPATLGSVANAMKKLDSQKLEKITSALDPSITRKLSNTDTEFAKKIHVIAKRTGNWDLVDVVGSLKQGEFPPGGSFSKVGKGPGALVGFCKDNKVLCGAPLFIGGAKWIYGEMSETVATKESIKCTSACLPKNWDEHIYGSPPIAKSELQYSTLQEAKEADSDFDGKADEFCTSGIDDCGEFCKDRCLERYGESRVESVASGVTDAVEEAAAAAARAAANAAKEAARAGADAGGIFLEELFGEYWWAWLLGIVVLLAFGGYAFKRAMG